MAAAASSRRTSPAARRGLSLRRSSRSFPMSQPLAGRHIAVLMGGLSPEREISLISGKACAEALERLGAKVSEVDAGRDVGEVLARHKPDVAFNALHGEWGEDGCIQGVLE